MKKIFMTLCLFLFVIGCSTVQPINNPNIANTIESIDEALKDVKENDTDSDAVKYEKKYKKLVLENAKADILALEKDNKNLTKEKSKSDKIANENSNKAYLVNFFIGLGIFLLIGFFLYIVYRVIKKLSLFGL